MALFTALALGGAAIKMGSKYYAKKKNKPKQFEHSYQGRFLKGLSETGIYSPEVKRNLMGRMGSELGGVASRRTAQNRGYLASKGMTGGMGGASISAAKLMDAPTRDMQRTMGKESLRLETENEMSKLNAREKLSTGKDISREKKRAWRSDFYGSMGEDIGNVATGAMGGGLKGAGMSSMLGGQNYLGMKQYQSDDELNSEYERIMQLMGGGGNSVY